MFLLNGADPHATNASRPPSTALSCVPCQCTGDMNAMRSVNLIACAARSNSA